MIFFDTNVLVAASMPSHEHHEPCLARLNLIAGVGGACAARSLAEAFSTCTRMPPAFRFTPGEALAVLEQTSRVFSVVVLTAEKTLAAINDFAKRI